ncbi:MAG: hypothetical protein AMJ38_05085 [Dehalococcoidia bacterium DG_22]|nr:MAG: hypothetical protein AMJ38_05085 [Dehalococcoidia bacterium DG_22]
MPSMENEASLPRPIDNGQVDQTVVEYTDHTALQTGRMLRAVVDEDGKGKWEYFGPLVEAK